MRVVPQAVARPSDEAAELARRALAAPLSVPRDWEFGALEPSRDRECTIGVSLPTAPRVGISRLEELGRFYDYRISDRRLHVLFKPYAPLNLYRMGYLFQSTYLTGALDDEDIARYDEAVCVNDATSEVWVAPSL